MPRLLSLAEIQTTLSRYPLCIGAGYLEHIMEALTEEANKPKPRRVPDKLYSIHYFFYTTHVNFEERGNPIRESIFVPDNYYILHNWMKYTQADIDQAIELYKEFMPPDPTSFWWGCECWHTAYQALKDSGDLQDPNKITYVCLKIPSRKIKYYKIIAKNGLPYDDKTCS